MCITVIKLALQWTLEMLCSEVKNPSSVVLPSTASMCFASNGQQLTQLQGWGSLRLMTDYW
jgi:hypothetical protein